MIDSDSSSVRVRPTTGEPDDLGHPDAGAAAVVA